MFAKYLGFNFVALAVFLADRFLKIFFQKNPTATFGGDFFYGLITFHFAKNTGIAFGIKINQVFLLGLIFIMTIFLASLILLEYKKRNILNTTALFFILIGALSNLADRLKFGYVVDYIDLKYFTIFNLADVAITFGVILLGIGIFFFDNKKNRTSL